MSPLPTGLLHLLQRTESQVAGRSVPSTTKIAIIVTAAIVTALILATSIFALHRAWTYIILPRILAKHSQAIQEAATQSERRGSNWARKHSNVLWSMYIDDDDLISQFPQPPHRGSRLFSIGSVSTVDHGRCPLDKRGMPGYKEEGFETQDLEKPATATTVTTASTMTDENAVRSRATYEQQTTPTKILSRNVTRSRADSCGPRHARQITNDTSSRRHSAIGYHLTKHSRHISADIVGSVLAAMDKAKNAEK